MSSVQGAAIRYPRGYRRIISMSQMEVEKHYGVFDSCQENNLQWLYSEGDPEVGKLYEELRSSFGNPNSWEYVLRVIKCAKRLIPDMDRFFVDQKCNPYLHGMNFDYLYEVAKFINCGRRGVSNVNHLALLSDHCTRSTIDPHRKVPRLDAPVRLAGATRQHYLSKWLSHSGGIEDIVCTLYVLFGMNTRV